MAENTTPSANHIDSPESTIDTAETSRSHAKHRETSESVRFYMHARGSGQINLKRTLAGMVNTYFPTGADLHAMFDPETKTLTVREM